MSELTIADVAQDVVQHPGVSMGITADVHKRVWAALSKHVEEILSTKKGIMIPGFGHFTFRRHEVTVGTYGTRVTLVPTFSFHPAFCSQHGLSAAKAVKPGPIITVLLNTASLTLASGFSKDTIANSLKDMTRRIGEIASQGRALTLDFGVCRVTIRNRKFRVSWNLDFVRAVRDFEGTHPALQRISAQVLACVSTFDSRKDPLEDSGTKSSGMKMTKGSNAAPAFTTSQDTINRAARARAYANLSTGKASLPQPGQSPAQASTGTGPLIADHKAKSVPQPHRLSRTVAEDDIVPSDLPAQLAASSTTAAGNAVMPMRKRRAFGSLASEGAGDSPAIVPSEQRPRTAEIAPSIPLDKSPAATQTTPPLEATEPPKRISTPLTTTTATTSASKKNPFANSFGDIGVYSPPSEDLTPFQKAKMTKWKFRQARKKGYADSWDAQIAEKARQVLQQEEEGKAEQRRFQEQLRSQMEYERQLELSRKMQAKEVHNENVKMMQKASNGTQPRYLPMGNIFADTCEFKPAPPDVSFLKSQIEQKQSLLRRERETEREYESRLADANIKRHQADQAEELEMKKRMQQKLRAELDRQLREVSQYPTLPGRYKDNVESGTDVFGTEATATELFEIDKKEKEENRMRLREIARKSQEEEDLRKQREKEQKQREMDEERRRAEAARLRVLEEERKLREANRQQKQRMKAAWDHQVGLKSEKIKALRAHDQAIQHGTYFRKNESSDEED